MHIYSFNDLKFTLKHLKRSTHTQHTRHDATAPTQRNDVNH